MKPTTRRLSATAPGQQASSSILSNIGILTLDHLFEASTEQLLAGFVKHCYKTPKPGLKREELQVLFLKESNVDMDLELSSISSDKRSTSAKHTATRLLDIHDTLLAQKQSFAELLRQNERNALPQLQELDLRTSQLRETVERLEQQAESLKQQRASLDSMIEELKSARVASAASGHIPPNKKVEHQLRLTGLQEDEDETQDDLLQKIHSVLHRLPKNLSAISAQRQGRPGGKKARAVVITFATAQERLDVLRTKASLGKNDETRAFSINELLSPEEQQHKNSLWPIFQQARHDGRRASFRGCDLFVDGQRIACPLQAGVPWDQHSSQPGPQAAAHPLSQPISLPGPPTGPQSYPSTSQAFQPMPVASTVPLYTPPSLYTNPLAQSQQPVQAYAAQHMHHAQSHPPNAWTHQQLQTQGPLGYMAKSPLAMRPQ